MTKGAEIWLKQTGLTLVTDLYSDDEKEKGDLFMKMKWKGMLSVLLAEVLALSPAAIESKAAEAQAPLLWKDEYIMDYMEESVSGAPSFIFDRTQSPRTQTVEEIWTQNKPDNSVFHTTGTVLWDGGKDSAGCYGKYYDNKCFYYKDTTYRSAGSGAGLIRDNAPEAESYVYSLGNSSGGTVVSVHSTALPSASNAPNLKYVSVINNSDKLLNVNINGTAAKYIKLDGNIQINGSADGYILVFSAPVSLTDDSKLSNCSIITSGAREGIFKNTENSDLWIVGNGNFGYEVNIKVHNLYIDSLRFLAYVARFVNNKTSYWVTSNFRANYVHMLNNYIHVTESLYPQNEYGVAADIAMQPFIDSVFDDGSFVEIDKSSYIPNSYFKGSINLSASIKTVDKARAYAFYGVKLSDTEILQGSVIEDWAFANTGLSLSEITLPMTIGDNAFAENGIEELTIHGNGDFNSSAFPELKNLMIDDDFVNFDSDISSHNHLEKVYLLSRPGGAMTKAKLPQSAAIYVEKDSLADIWCENNDVYHNHLSEKEIDEIKNGSAPSIVQDTKLFEGDSPEDISFEVSLGKKPAGADGIKSVYVSNEKLTTDDYSFNGTDTLIMKSSYLSKLPNGIHSVSVLFDNNSYKGGGAIDIKGSSIGSGDEGGNQKPPEALVTIRYEFYKDYPDYVIIPVKMNSASDIVSLTIGEELVDKQYFRLQEGAIVIDSEYLSMLESAKYRVLPTFDDAANTTISNIQLIVYDAAADRAAPYLLQSVINFTGQTLRLRYDPGYGDLKSSNVLAMVLDDDLILPDGKKLPFTGSNVNQIQKARTSILEQEINTATPSNATRTATPSNVFAGMSGSDVDADNVFYVDEDEIVWDGDYITSLNLKKGDHLVGAVFDNTERTTDVKKVVLTIPGSDEDNTGENRPSGGDNKPSGGNNISITKPSGGFSGGSGGGSRRPSSNSGGSITYGPGIPLNIKPIHTDGSFNSQYKPEVTETGGKWQGSGDEWSYRKNDKTMARNEWIGHEGESYYLNAEGVMETGWYLDTTGKWYMLNTDHNGKFGASLTGWYHEKADGKWYFMNPADKAMMTGWQFIDSKNYYLAEVVASQTYFGDNINGWFYDPTKGRPYGSMYENERTPDNHTVDASGARID